MAKKLQEKSHSITGTKEWAAVNVNIVLGCEHRCRYCYARSRMHDLKRFSQYSDWGTTYYRLRPDEVGRKHKKYNGTVMFPTTHDITPQFLEPGVAVLRNLLEAGNDVLVVSKPTLPCIERLCVEFAGSKDQILFRFTIGAMDDDVLGYWDTHAPLFQERFDSLKLAFSAGFKTSVSVEPMLDSPNVVNLFHCLAPYVTHSIWIGKMNEAMRRVKPQTQAELEAVQRLEANQSDDRIRAIYDALKHEPLVRWKDSIKRVVGLPLATEAGLDV